MPAIPISHVLPRETFAPAWEDSISEFGDRFQPSQMSIRYCLSKKICSSKNTTRISVCYLYFHRFHACSFPWETSEKHSTILSLGRPVPVQRPFSRDNLLYRVNQCWFVVITWPLKARELKRERQFFFQFSRIFYTSKEKFYIPFYKKKKKKFLRISSINSPFNRCFHAIIHFYHRANQCYHILLNIRKLMKRIFLLLFSFFFFFQISHAFHFQGKLCASLGKISLNFRSSTTTIISFVASLIHRSHIPSNTRKLHSTRVNGRVF